MARRSLKELVNDWKATVKEYTESDGSHWKFSSFMQSGKGRKSFTEAVTKFGKGARQVFTTSTYLGSSAEDKR